MPRTATFLDMPGVDIGIEYNSSNLRITEVSWNITAVVTIQARIFMDGSLIYEKIVHGPATGSENVPGNHRLVETIDPIDGHFYLAWPVGLTAEVGPI